MLSGSIGVFDSGVGGLSVLDVLVKTLPDEQFVYVGDTAHMPYGERSPEEICHLARGIVDYLINEHQVKMLVVACNTSAGILSDYWQNECPVPVIEPVLPITGWLAENPKQYAKLGLMATQGTIESGRYQKEIACNTDLSLIPIICTGFAKLVEDGKINTPEGKAMLKRFLEPLAKQNVEAVIHGCTHYPFAETVLSQLWSELSDKPLAWLNPADWMAEQAAKTLRKTDAFEIEKGASVLKGSVQYRVSGNPAEFEKSASCLPLNHLQVAGTQQFKFTEVKAKIS